VKRLEEVQREGFAIFIVLMLVKLEGEQARLKEVPTETGYIYKIVLHTVIRCNRMSISTVRVPRKVKEKLEKYNVNVSETVRRFLDEYLTELEMKNLTERLESLRERLGGKIDPEQIANLVREDRESR